MDRAALEESGVLTERFLEDVASIAREVDGDAKRLVAALGENRGPRLRSFRRSSAERLRRHLVESGCLDERPILTEGELQLRALTSPAANGLPGGVARACLKRWWEWARKFSGPEPR